METDSLTHFIEEYIEKRRQAKLETFDKEAEKKRSALSGDALAAVELELAQSRCEIERRHEVRTWLTEAASSAGQISLVTHALKFTHASARGTSIISPVKAADPTSLSTATLAHPDLDAVGNAAEMHVAKLLQAEYEGDSLAAALQRKEALLNKSELVATAPLADRLLCDPDAVRHS